MEKLTGYLQKMFGSQMDLRQYGGGDDLPMYLTAAYQLYTVRLGADRYVLAKPKEPVKLKIDTLQKQLTQLRKFTRGPPVLVLDHLRLVQRHALIQAGIAFVVPEQQLYIPPCAIHLVETETVAQEYGSRFNPATQVVFIYLLLHKMKQTNAHQLSAQLPYSVATLNRALKELSFRNLLETVGSGTRKQYTVSSGTQFWAGGKQYLFDPVKSRRYVPPEFECAGFLTSGESALGSLSFLNVTDTPCCAVSPQDLKKIDKASFLKEYDLFGQPYKVLELFRYDPKIIAQGTHVDVISLYAQFRDSRDERIQIEIESLVHEILW